MAIVYKGSDLTLGRTVAIKILSEDLAEDPSFVARFRLEAQAAASLTHPNIVAVYDTGSDGDTHYIVMEYLEGRTLHQILNEDGTIPPADVASIGAEVAQALNEAHEKGIVHRDVKPGNIMIGRGGTAKVMDFGIAKAATAGNLTQVGSILGTVAYLSPEQARGEPVDGRSDIYSLGLPPLPDAHRKAPSQGRHLRRDGPQAELGGTHLSVADQPRRAGRAGCSGHACPGKGPGRSLPDGDRDGGGPAGQHARSPPSARRPTARSRWRAIRRWWRRRSGPGATTPQGLSPPGLRSGPGIPGHRRATTPARP